MTTGSFSFHCRLIYYGQFRLCDKWRYNGSYSALTLSGCRDSDSQFLWKKKGDGLGLYSFVSQLYAVKQFRKHVNIISTFRGHRHNSGAASAPGFSGSSAKSSYTCGYIFSLLYVLTHLRAQSITSLHLWEQAKNALSSTARPAHTVADTLCITGCRMNAFSGWCSCF